ncbi:class I adenylate-forming enzyme family protein [Wenxinia marina]|uniref:Acyl-CoA synthetase (AMP-forming)/AMP-acid ligase II n=1 Tax=Wenxinia marina DSM 24838 TaxID=1123501 RepID=A0A0D0Q4B2_9RHOB|nr:AMP-binding protein [Wenxinia marina]KIQ69369.1 Acyl-CoA synthetase (AMP-forming)/AMP-acid ligase II [Wenxinia marina DSM 24838]GGL57767.1 ATP-dependent acyl-CoA ligase [Wenxinia marina]
MRPDDLAGLSPFAGTDAARWIDQRAAVHPDRPMLVWAPPEGPGRIWSYAEAADAVARLAGGMAARGIRPGDRVLLHLENGPETLLARFACARLGAVAVLSNAMATGPELAAKMEITGPRAAVTSSTMAPVIAAHAPRPLDWIAATGDAPEGALPVDALYGDPQPARDPDPAAPALILFTTGTTSRPKAVLWTHENLLWAASLGARQQGFLPADVALAFLPLFHVVGFSWLVLPTLWVGGTVVLQPRFSASRFWPLAVEHKATVAAQVPFTLNALAAQPAPETHDFRLWIVNRQVPEAQARYGIPRVSSAWGMTEMVSQPILGDSDGTTGDGAIGRPSQGYRVRIVDEDGGDVAPGEIGELAVGGVPGRSIFAEYVGRPETTAEAFDGSGFFRTGDRVRQDPDGAIRFVDRIKDVIKVGGEGVSAAEIEAVIAAVPGVAEVAVVPRPDPMRGEVPVAFVVATDGSDPDAVCATIRAACAERLARFKQPAELRLLDAIPRVGFGKIAKGELGRLAAEGAEVP